MADCEYLGCNEWKATCEVCAQMDAHYCIDHGANMTQIGIAVICPNCIEQETCCECPEHSTLVVRCVMCNGRDTKCVNHTGFATILSERATGLCCSKCESRSVCNICYLSDREMSSCAICGLCSCTTCTVFEHIDWSHYCHNKNNHPAIPINPCRLVDICASCLPDIAYVTKKLPCGYCSSV